jgi:sialic acid synthase
MRKLSIDGTNIDDDTPCYVIAEIGANHMGQLDICKQIIKGAHDAGANAVKLQKRDNISLYTKEMFDSPYDNRNSYGNTYGEHREFLEFGRDEFLEIKKYCAEIGITFFATAFDVPSVDFLEELDLPAYKVASGDLTNIPLLRYVAAIGKPVVFSSGGGSMEDVQRAYDVVAPLNDQICIMQCTSGYPADFDQLNLNVIKTYCETFPDAVIGYSGHENGIAIPLIAYMLGARVVEKHFTLNRTWKGTDQAFSLTPEGLRKMVRDLKRAHLAVGSSEKRALEVEEGPMRKMKKKLVAARDLPSGHVLREADIAMKSPGDGLPPYELEKLLGKTLRNPLAQGVNISFSLLD